MSHPDKPDSTPASVTKDRVGKRKGYIGAVNPPSAADIAVSPHPRRLTVALAVVHALLFRASFPGPGLWPLTWLSVIPLAWLAIRAATMRRAVLAVFVVQLLMWLWIDRWIIGVTAAGYPALSVYMSLYAVIFVWVIRRVSRDPVLGRLPATLTVPVAWAGLEFLRGSIAFNGYPWYLVAHPVVEWPLCAQTADLLGTYFVSFLVTMVGGAVVDGLRASRAAMPVNRAIGSMAAALVLTAAAIGYGGWRLAEEGPPSPGPEILVIQTNLPQDNKIDWTIEQQVEDVKHFIALTRQAWDEARGAGVTPMLVAWPETMLPGMGLEPATIATLVEGRYLPGDAFSSAIEQLAAELGVPMLVGSPVFIGLRPEGLRWAWDEHYNSAYLVTGSPPFDRYDKCFLTPFGEVMPYISAWPWLEEKLLAIGARGMRFDLDAADEITRFELPWPRPGASTPRPQAVGFATPICFEDTVAHVCRRMIYEEGAKKADFFVGLSNDGWFGANDAGRAHHAQIARFRCIENRVPMIRSVNTGLSIAVDSAGRVTGAVGEGRSGTARQDGWLRSELGLDDRSTLYGRVGDAWGWACLAGTVGLGAATFRRSLRGTAPS